MIDECTDIAYNVTAPAAGGVVSSRSVLPASCVLSMVAIGGDRGVSLCPDTQDLTKGCPVMVGHPRFNQIINNSHRTFANLHTVSIQNSSMAQVTTSNQ